MMIHMKWKKIPLLNSLLQKQVNVMNINLGSPISNVNI